MKSLATFFSRCIRLVFTGDWRYWSWLGILFVICLLGLNAYCKQLVDGLIVTGMSDEVSWGVYIANFTFLVGVAAAAVMMIIPVFIYRNKELHDLVIFGELLAIAAILMSLAFIMVDLGRPDKFWHLIPGIGQFNFPSSLLSWDTVTLNGYLLLNIYICGYLLYSRYHGRTPAKWLYLPFVFISIVWAVCVLTVEAFLYVGLGSRPFWNTAIVAPRFIASAFTAGPALMILAMQVVRRVTAVDDSVKHEGEPVKTTVYSPTEAELETLARVMPEFKSVPGDVQQSLLRELKVVEVPEGGTLLRQEEKEAHAFFVLEGHVEVTRKEHGHNFITRNVRSGGQFGEVSALSGIPRMATATAVAPSKVLQLPVTVLRKLMKYPEMNRVIHSRMEERLMITDRGLLTLRAIVQVSMIINIVLLFNEVFTEFYTGSHHSASSRYLFLGLDGHHGLVPWIWTAIGFNIIALILLVLPLSRGLKWLNVACVLCILGIWIEKGMGMVIPGFVPTPLGEIIEYQPRLNETLICLGIWAFGFILYTILLRVAVPILQGRVTSANEPAKPKREPQSTSEAAPAGS